jgi:hypothetical protein
MEELTLDLLDNGIDYIVQAVSPFLVYDSFDESQRSLKYSTLHLSSGIELLLKERLKQEHWSLIFQDISSADRRKLQDGDFASVYHDELVKRLKGILNIDIDDKPFKKLRALRNRFEHFEVKVSVGECKETLFSALDEVIKFWDKYLVDNSTIEQRERFERIKFAVTGYEEYRRRKLEKSEAVINQITRSGNGILAMCPSCQGLGFMIFKDDREMCKCLICDEALTKDDYLAGRRRREEEDENLAYSSFEKYNIKCPSCGLEKRIRDEISDDITLDYCLGCLDERRISKQEQSSKEFSELIEKLSAEHTPLEFMSIIEDKIFEIEEQLVELGDMSREELKAIRRARLESKLASLQEELERRGYEAEQC